MKSAIIRKIQRKSRAAPPWTGFTLIEVLVAVFVLAVGALGIAGMQAVTVREAGNLYFRTQADLLVTDIVDRMRANRSAARAPNSVYDGVSSASSADTSLADSCVGSSCSPAAIARFDIAQWAAAIDASHLPLAEGFIEHIDDSIDATGNVVGAVYHIRLYWDEDREGSVSTTQACALSVSSDSGCLRLQVQI